MGNKEVQDIPPPPPPLPATIWFPSTEKGPGCKDSFSPPRTAPPLSAVLSPSYCVQSPLMSVLLCHLPVTYNLLSCHPLSYTISCLVTFCPIQSPVMSASYHITLLSCTISCMSPSCQVQSPVLSPSVIDNLLLCHPPVIYNLLLCHLLSCTISCHVTLLSHHPPLMYNLLLCHLL